MPAPTAFRRLFTRLHRHEGGAALLFVGLGLMTLLAATGIAIDMSRLQTVQAKLSQSLDAAGLAAGSKVHSTDAEDVVQNYMLVNFPDGFMDSRVTDVDVVVNADNTIINLSATAEVDMTFMQIFGQPTQEVSASSEITRENRGLELVMVLDITGSMYGTKISDLRTASTDMVNILFGQKESMENLWVGIVPYVTTVNVGADKTSWLRDYDESRYTNKYPNWATKWKGCVEARGQYPEDDELGLNDDVPYTGNKATATPEQLATTFPMYFWESNWDNQWIDPNNGNVSLNQDQGYSDGAARGPNIGCGNEVTPFTNQKSVAQGAVDALHPWRRGGTMSSQGLIWGWRMISPKWRGMWGHQDATLPLDYNTPLMSKAVIVMTDGVNEVFSPHSNPPGGSDYTSFRRIQEERMGNNVDTKAEGVAAVNAKFASICSRMKAQGILIYTVTFRLGTSTAHNNARALFRNCATHPDYYFDSPDGATLRQSFRTIGDSLANLMISR